MSGGKVRCSRPHRLGNSGSKPGRADSGIHVASRATDGTGGPLFGGMSLIDRGSELIRSRRGVGRRFDDRTTVPVQFTNSQSSHIIAGGGLSA